MKKLIAIQRKKGEILGVVEFMEGGRRKFARFSPQWSDNQVCRHFGLEPADRTEPERAAQPARSSEKINGNGNNAKP